MGKAQRTTGSEATRALLASGASGVLAVMPVFLLGALAVLVREDLGFSERELGAAVSIYYATSALLSVAGGRISERLGAGPALRLSAACSAVAGIIVGAVVHSWLEFVGALLLAAFANAVAQPAANLALARAIPYHRQGWAFGLKQSAGPGAVLVAGITVPVLGLTVGWRWAYSLTVVFGLLTWILASGQGRPVEPSRTRRRVGDVATGPLALMSAAIVLAVAGASGLGAFFVESAVHQGHATGAAGLWLTAGSIASIAVRIALGRWADRRDRGYMKMVIRLLMLGAAGFAMLGYAGSAWVLLPATILAFGAGWGWPGLYQFAIVRLNPGAPGDATGVIMVGMFAGGSIGPVVFGSLVEAFSYEVAWWTFSAALVGSAVLTHYALGSVRRDIASRTATPVRPATASPDSGTA